MPKRWRVVSGTSATWTVEEKDSQGNWKEVARRRPSLGSKEAVETEIEELRRSEIIKDQGTG